MNAPAPSLRILVCGNGDRGDDGAALAAIAHVLPRLEPRLRGMLEVRRCEQLDATDLIDVRDDEACLVLDTVVGIEPGTVVRLPLRGLIRPGSLSPRSSHALPIDQVVALAEAVRGRLPTGAFVGIGGKWFGFGPTRSRALRDGLPEFERAVSTAIGDLVAAGRDDRPVVTRPGRPRLAAAR